MNENKLPFKKMVFVCTNARKPGERISCAGEGRCGERVLETLKEYVKAHHLSDRIRIAKSGCQERCEMGPNLIVLPHNQFVSDIRSEDIPKIIETYLSLPPQ